MPTNPFGSGTRPWRRATAAKIATDTTVRATAELVIGDDQTMRVPDGTTQTKNLSVFYPVPLGGQTTFKAPDFSKGSAAQQAFWNSLPVSGESDVKLPSGDLTMSDQANGAGGRPFSLFAPRSGINLIGKGPGATRLLYASNGRPLIFSGLGPGYLAGTSGWTSPLSNNQWITTRTVYPFANPLAAGALSFQLSSSDYTAAVAAGLAVGTSLFLRTGQCVSFGAGSNREPDAEISRVLALDSGSFTVYLDRPTRKPYQQEYYINPTVDGSGNFTGYDGTGPSSAPGANTSYPALYGVSLFGANEVLRDITIRDFTVDVSGSNSTGLYFHQADGVLVDNVSVTNYDSFGLTGRYTRDVEVRGCYFHRGQTTDVNPAVWGPATGGTGWHVHDCIADGYVGRLHIHEGAADYTLANCKIMQIDAPANGSVASALSVRGRSYNLQVHDNTFQGNLTGANCDIVYIENTCVAGGRIYDNKFLSKGANTSKGLNLNGNGWLIDNNDWPTGATFADTGTGNVRRNNTPSSFNNVAGGGSSGAPSQSVGSVVTS